MSCSSTSFSRLRQLLFPDHSTASLPGRPTFQLYGVDAFVASLPQADAEHKCLIIGTVRRELFLEILWQRIVDASGSGEVDITPHVMEEWEMVLSFSGCVWKLAYARREERQVKERLAHWEMVESRSRDRGFRYCYSFLIERRWLVERGIYNDGRQSVSDALDIEQVTSMILEFSVKTSTQHLETEHDHISAFFASYSPDSGKAANLPRTARLEFAKAHKQMQEGGLAALTSRPSPVQAMDAPLYIKFSHQWTGYSDIQGALTLKDLYREIHDLVQAQQLRSTTSTHVRLWPDALVAAEADVSDVPYEAFYLVGISPCTAGDAQSASTAAESLRTDYEKTETAKDVVAHVEVVDAIAMAKQAVKASPKSWPRARAKPPPELAHLHLHLQPDHRPPARSKHRSGSGLTTDGKGQRMRPALDVLNRLRYDPRYSIDGFVIGYLDRHAGVVEKAAGSWEVDSTCEEWIPQHKILYFRSERGGKVWEREGRLDLVFGSAAQK